MRGWFENEEGLREIADRDSEFAEAERVRQLKHAAAPSARADRGTGDRRRAGWVLLLVIVVIFVGSVALVNPVLAGALLVVIAALALIGRWLLR